ncbi:MAG: dephospho-CoA kinase [Muribaculaceae bacterium]|nr:dephospho-CoA kinase [Muribaculaceae bacterium]
MMATEIIGITGGIGSGKSVVSRILRILGHAVYDCDSQAKQLMDGSDCIKSRIMQEIDRRSVDDLGNINRQRLSSVVFSDKDALARLNEIVHGAVRQDLLEWVNRQVAQRVWVETAILYESGLDKIVDKVWHVEAPLEMRIKRVMLRNSVTRAQVEARIASQPVVSDHKHPDISLIVNDGKLSLLQRIEGLLSL